MIQCWPIIEYLERAKNRRNALHSIAAQSAQQEVENGTVMQARKFNTGRSWPSDSSAAAIVMETHNMLNAPYDCITSINRQLDVRKCEENWWLSHRVEWRLLVIDFIQSQQK